MKNKLLSLMPLAFVSLFADNQIYNLPEDIINYRLETQGSSIIFSSRFALYNKEQTKVIYIFKSRTSDDLYEDSHRLSVVFKF